jgi:arsenite methyltransferase
MKTILTEEQNDSVRRLVREGYSKIAQDTSASDCCTGVSCCGSAPQEAGKLAQQLGYSAAELQALPEGANMGLSCGNPAALAALQPGETVLDLGSGGGFDVFIAGRKVGATGRAIGVDMTPDMLAKARRNVAHYRKETGLENVGFRLGEIEHLPIADNSVDVIISNCVINLSPDKPQVWREIARVLKPGGRVAVSDMALLKPLPPEILKMVEALVGCVAGAVLVSETESLARKAGLSDIAVKIKPEYVAALAQFEDPIYQKIVEHLPAGTQPADYVASVEVTARKAHPDKFMRLTTEFIQVFDPAMCCSTGICGPDVDTKLVQFAADLDWLKGEGVIIQRHNLSQNPAAFVENKLVQATLTEKGEAALPLLLVNGKVAVTGRYPDRKELAKLLKVEFSAASATTKSSCCCDGGTC